MTEIEIDDLAKKLANHYQGENCGICACLGIECYNPSDSRWWREFLTLFNREDIEEMVEMYINAKCYPQIKAGE